MKCKIRSTTVICIRRDNKVVMAGDGQVHAGQRSHQGVGQEAAALYNDKVLAGFAGSTADAFALFARFETKLEQFNGNLFALGGGTGQGLAAPTGILRHLEAILLVAGRQVQPTLVRRDRRRFIEHRRRHRGDRLGAAQYAPGGGHRAAAQHQAFRTATSRSRPWRSRARSASSPTTNSPMRSWSSHGDLSPRSVRG